MKMNLLMYDSLCFLISMSLRNADGQTLNDSETLMNDNLSGYDRRHMPVLNKSKSVSVNVTLHLFELTEFDEFVGKFVISATYTLAWQDERISWNSSEYGGISWQYYELDSVWYPEFTLLSAYEESGNTIYDWMKVKIHANGLAEVSPGGLIKSKCPIDATYYPFDTQVCSFTLVSRSFMFAELEIISTLPSVNQRFYTNNKLWTLQNTTAESGKMVFSENIDFAYVKYTFTLKRNCGIIAIVIAPYSLLVFLSVCVFLLPAESRDRLPFTITALLAQAVFLTLIGSYMPQSLNPSSLLFLFLLVQLLNSAAMSACTIFIILVNNNTHGVPPKWILIIFRLPCLCKKSSTAEKHTSKVPDTTNDRHELCSQTISVTESDVNNHTLPETIKWNDVTNRIDTFFSVFFFLVEIVIVLSFVTVFVKSV